MSQDLRELLVRRVFPWVVFFACVAALKHFWALIFLAYVLGSLMTGAIARMQRFTGATYRRAVFLSYFALVCFILVGLLLLVPKAYRESIAFGTHQFPEFEKNIARSLKEHMPEENYETLRKSVKQTFEDMQPGSVIEDAAAIFRGVGTSVLFAFLSIVLSFLVLLDPESILAAAGAIRRSGVGWIWDEIAPPVAEFFGIISKVFDAQIVIAAVNTTLTLAGMLLLGIPGEMFLAVTVFFCGFIPIFGAWFSSVPIVITALVQPDGPVLAFKAVLMILLVHLIEAYVLNPRITGAHLKMHPLTVMVTLLVSEHFFGLWGIMLGVPCISFIAYRFITPPSAPMTSSECAPAS